MKLIEKIEIKNFRSFSGTKEEEASLIYDLKDLNIISGSNDSGKSNILRALNLFFNNKVTNSEIFIFDKNFPIWKKDSGVKVTEIKIDFDLSWDENRNKFLPPKFSISKIYDRFNQDERNYFYLFSDKNGNLIKIDSRGSQYNQGIDKELKYRQQFPGFINRISYEYIPAIRENIFFSNLYGRTIFEIKNIEESKIKELESEKKRIENYQKTIKNKGVDLEYKVKLDDSEWRKSRTKEIEKEIKKEGKIKDAIFHLENEINKFSSNLFGSIKFLPSEFKISDNLIEFFESFEIGTGENKNISLKLRGDGVQSKYIPEVLNFLSTIQEGKKYFIWGFEEPENSLEYKNQQEIAKQFLKLSDKKQIFLTTHSEEFLQLYNNGEKSNLYYVVKNDNFSQILMFDPDKEDFQLFGKDYLTQEHLGTSYLRAKYSKELKAQNDEFLKAQEEKQKLVEDIVELKAKSNIPIFCENKNADDLNNLGFNNITFLGSQDKNYAFNASKTKGSLVYSLIDRDYITDGEKKYIEENTNVRIFDFYCFENYLYHPENLKEYYESKGLPFNLVGYIENIMNEFKEKRVENIMKIESGRQSHKEINNFTKGIRNNNEYNFLNDTTDFLEFYKMFSMKTYCTELNERQNINKQDLINTNWFRNKIKNHLVSMGITIN